MVIALELRTVYAKPDANGKENRNDCHNGDRLCRGKVVGVLHGEQIGKAFQIRVTKRCNTFGKNASVDRAEEQPETADQYTEQCSVLEQVDK